MEGMHPSDLLSGSYTRLQILEEFENEVHALARQAQHTVGLQDVWSVVGVPQLPEVIPYPLSQPIFIPTSLAEPASSTSTPTATANTITWGSEPSRHHPYQHSPRSTPPSSPRFPSRTLPAPSSRTASPTPTPKPSPKLQYGKHFRKAFSILLRQREDFMQSWLERIEQRKCSVARAPCIKVYLEFCLDSGGDFLQLASSPHYAKLGTQAVCACDSQFLRSSAPLPSSLTSSFSSSAASPLSTSSSSIPIITQTKTSPCNPSSNPEANCVICFDHAINSVCVPCGHLAMCFNCAKKVKQTNKCPVCRARITDVYKTYSVV